MLLSTVAGVGCFLELVGYFAAPWLFARLAFIPIGKPRRVVLSRAAWEALSIEPPNAGGYRQAVARVFDPALLRVPAKFETDHVVGHVFPARGFATARLPYRLTDKSLALARIDLLEANGAVELRTVFIPFSWATMVLVVPVALGVSLVTNGPLALLDPIMLVAAVFGVVGLGISYFMTRSRIERAADEVSRHVQDALALAGNR